MGKKAKDKKKGKGAEKTQTKTDKKISSKIKKELKARGEDDIESIVAQIEKEEKERLKVTEATVDPPSRRINFTFVAHPDKDQLVLYGGEFFNGQKTFVYNDLLFYNIPNNTWSIVKAPAGPPPRCGHQMVVTSANKGQLWIFGGEFASPTQSQFYHYRDLWVFHMATKQWEKITSSNGPSARSGHRMVFSKKQLIVFGGFHDNLRDYKYFNDIYSFNMETYSWSEIKAVGAPPAPRSGCCMVALPDNRILVYGGYSKERIKKDVDKGHVYNDAFILAPDKHDTTGMKFKWQQVKLGGTPVSPRCSMPMTVSANNKMAYCYGGVFDTEEDEESIAGNFYNDFLQLDLEKLVWREIKLTEKKDKEAKRRNKDGGDDEGDGQQESEQTMEVQDIEETMRETTISDDGVFKVTIGPTPAVSTSGQTDSSNESKTLFQPPARINCGLAIKHGVLYLYGGMFEDGDKELTFSDFYSIDLKKLEEWKTIIADDKLNMEWVGSESESEEESNGDDDDDEDASGESGMETD